MSAHTVLLDAQQNQTRTTGTKTSTRASHTGNQKRLRASTSGSANAINTANRHASAKRITPPTLQPWLTAMSLVDATTAAIAA